MQHIEFYAVRADTGAALSLPTVTVYLTGTTTPASLYGASGAALQNPFIGGGDGLVSFAAGDGVYDVAIVSGAYTAPMITGLQLADLAALSAGMPLNVKSLGAACDGVTDDTAALEAAIALVSTAVNSSNAQGGGVVKIPRGGMLRITRPVYLNAFVVIEGELASPGFFQNFTPGQVTGSGIFADFDFTSGGAIEAVGFVTATDQRIGTGTYIKGSQVDEGTYTHLTGAGLRNLFIYTNHTDAFCPVRFVGAPQFVLDGVTCQGFWHGPIANASWAGRIPSLFCQTLYTGLIIDQDCNGVQLGHLYLSGTLAGADANEIPPACAYPNWDPYGLNPADPNIQAAGANLLRTGLVVMAGDPASADVVISEGWNVAAVVHSSGLTCNAFECENIFSWVFSVYASRLVVHNLFTYTPGLNLLYGAELADVRLGIPEWVSEFLTSPVQYWSNYASSYVIEGLRQPNYPWTNNVVTYRAAEDSPYNDLYIDAVAGNDTVIGCAATSPLLTINQALTRFRPDKLNRIFFQQGQTHPIANNVPLETITITDCRVEFHSYTPASGVTTRPVLVAPPDTASVHTQGLILTRSSLLFQDVDYTLRMCVNAPEGYNAGLYIQGPCDVRFAGASTVLVESGAVEVGVFQPFYGRPGIVTWSLEDSASIGQYPGSASAGYLGVSAFQGQGLLSAIGSVNSSAAIPINAAILANGFMGSSYAGVSLPGQMARFPNGAALLASSSVTGDMAVSGAVTAAGQPVLTGADVGVVNGVAGLDSTGRVPTAQLPASIIGGLIYQGVWNAASNTPALASGVGSKGCYYKVGMAGTTTLDGTSSWSIGDLVIFDGATWDKIDGESTVVVSFQGRVGAITLTAADIAAALGYTPANPATVAGGYAPLAGVANGWGVGGALSVTGASILMGGFASSANSSVGGVLTAAQLNIAQAGANAEVDLELQTGGLNRFYFSVAGAAGQTFALNYCNAAGAWAGQVLSVDRTAGALTFDTAVTYAGASTFAAPPTVNLNAAAVASLPAVTSTSAFRVVNTDNTNTNLTIDSFGGWPTVLLRAASGTGAAPTPITNGQGMGRLFFEGYLNAASGYSQAALIQAVGTQAWSTSGAGASLVFSVAPNGSTALQSVLLIDQDGGTKPYANNAFNLGSAALQWANVYAVNGVFSAGASIAGAPVPSSTFGSGAPSATASEGAQYFNTATSPYTPYVYHAGGWRQVA